MNGISSGYGRRSSFSASILGIVKTGKIKQEAFIVLYKSLYAR